MNTDIIAEVLADLPDMVPQREYFQLAQSRSAEGTVLFAGALPAAAKDTVASLRPLPC
jgi:hypothetical protein